MLDCYDPSVFEAAWRAKWKEADLFKTREEPDRPKFYGLDFFPYPSGAGLSVGHCRNYIPTDVLCRMKFMQGFNVLHPMGFDAFGLPAENEAIKTGKHPGPMVQEYGATYRRQMELIGISYDWSRSFFSSDPDYYRWTQWIFEKLHEKGLAYRSKADVNWCPKDKTALANEEVVAGNCERCGTPVEKRAIPQWFFKITAYAQRLLDDLDDLDWPEGIKNQQRNWIGRSEGVEFDMKVVMADVDSDGDFHVKRNHTDFRVFTTRIDTIFGMTFCVLAPEHPLVDQLIADAPPQAADAMRDYREQAKVLGEQARLAADREKTGCDTGFKAINPATGLPVPIFIADYVLTGYGTGAIMAVPGNDQRDFDFAKKHGLKITPVIAPVEFASDLAAGNDHVQELVDSGKAFESKDGFLINSGEYTGLPVAEAIQKLADWVEACEIGSRKVNYKLRDWLISRQRYWGCPIPIIHDAEGNLETVPEDCLPVRLPDVEKYEPTDDGSSPLARIDSFLNVTTSDGQLGRRETDTMGGFACSSWYFLRFCDPHNHEEPWDHRKAAYWMPVDCYVGGAEHAVMHLLYARFWTKVLYDLGLVPVTEPFARLQNQGQVLGYTPYRKPREGETLDVGEDGILVSFAEAKTLDESELMWRWARMSKSKGNVVTPDEAVAEYGADALRVYELFVAPFDADVQWSSEGMAGAVRFLSRVIRLVSEIAPFFDPAWKHHVGNEEGTAKDVRRWTHQAIAKVSEDIEKFAFNTAISKLMITANNLSDAMKKNDEPGMAAALSEAAEAFILILSPFAPHTADELWSNLGKEGFTYQAAWPIADLSLAAEDTVTIAVQVNGKLRDTLELPATASAKEMEESALASPKVQAHLEGKEIRKVIVVAGKLVNIVAS